MDEFRLPVRQDRLVTGIDIWAVDIDRASTYVTSSTQTNTLISGGMITECSSTNVVAKNVKGQHVEFMMKANVPLVPGNSLRWVDKTAILINFLFTSSQNSAELFCGTNSLGVFTVLGGLSSITIDIPQI